MICFIIANPQTYPPPGEGICDEGWGEYGSHCYFFETTETATWRQAQIKCVEKHLTASLASVANPQENMYLAQELSARDPQNGAWIGMYASSNGIYLL